MAGLGKEFGRVGGRGGRGTARRFNVGRERFSRLGGSRSMILGLCVEVSWLSLEMEREEVVVDISGDI